MKENIVQSLGLERPLIIFDLETTGLSIPHDRIVQLAYQKHHLDGSVEANTMLLNPGRPIPPAVTEIHRITDEMVGDAPLFAEQAAALFEIFKDCFYGGFNIVRFDLPLLRQEFSRAGIAFRFRPEDIVDAKLVYNYMEPRDLTAAYKYYCNKAHEEAHDAGADVAATAEIVAEQIKRYGYETIRQIHDENCRDYVDLEGKFYRVDGEIHFAFSKFKGQTIAAVAKTDPTFLRWILQADFAEDTKEVVRQAIKNDNL